MKVLIISANTLPSAPSGPAYVAGAAIEAGHTVKVFETLFAQDLISELERQITNFSPDVVGISIRLVHGFVIDESAEFGTKHLDLRVRVKEIVDCIRRISDVHIVLGGPGFNYYGPNWLEYLNLDYGIRGEAEVSFPQYLKRLEEGEDIHSVPGCVFARMITSSKFQWNLWIAWMPQPFLLMSFLTLTNTMNMAFRPPSSPREDVNFVAPIVPTVHWKENATG